MLFNKRKVMFRADTTLPDPEILKFRFRRRVLWLALIGTLLLLSIPVIKDRSAGLFAQVEARSIAQLVLAIRLQAQTERHAYGLALTEANGRQEWQRLTFAGNSCKDKSSIGETLTQDEQFIRHMVMASQETPTVSHSIRSICFDPLYGLYADQELVAQGQVQILVTPHEDQNSDRQDRVKRVHVFGEGDSIALLW